MNACLVFRLFSSLDTSLSHKPQLRSIGFITMVIIVSAFFLGVVFFFKGIFLARRELNRYASLENVSPYLTPFYYNRTFD